MPHSPPLSLEITALPPEMVAAATAHAENMADVVGEYLIRIGALKPDEPSSSEPTRFPAWALLELAAVLKLQKWELGGLSEHLGDEIPPYQSASGAFVRRVEQGAGDRDTPGNTVMLSSQLLRVWLERCAWHAPELLRSDVVLGAIDNDEIAERLADLLWAHRHDIENQPTGEER